MALTFTGDEVLQIAMEMEQTGEVFYEALAAVCRNRPVTDMIRKFARNEQDHYQTFKRMREERADTWPVRDLDPDELSFTQSLINEKVIPSPDDMRKLAASTGLADALAMAVKMEHDSIRFYQELLAGLAASDVEVVEQIIQEERLHQRELEEAQRAL